MESDVEGLGWSARATARDYVEAAARYLQSGALDVAEDHLRQARNCDPAFVDTHYYLGRLYATYKNDPEAARVHLQRALALDPTMAPALELMAALDQSEHYSESDAANEEEADASTIGGDDIPKLTLAAHSEEGTTVAGDESGAVAATHAEIQDTDNTATAAATSTPPYMAHIRSMLRFRDLRVPPINFGMVAPGIYRSGYPNSRNFPFLTKLGIKSIVNLNREPYMVANANYALLNNIRVHQIKAQTNVEPFLQTNPLLVVEALKILIDVRNHPVLVHCTKGGHKTGLIVGCLRKLQNWSYTAIFAEFRRYVEEDDTPIMDEQFIEMFDVASVKVASAHAPPWLTAFVSSRQLIQ